MYVYLLLLVVSRRRPGGRLYNGVRTRTRTPVHTQYSP